MQIVIDIPNSTFTDLKKKQNRTEVDVAVLNGIPLQKGHGRIADMDAAIKCIKECEGDDAIWAISLIDWACGKHTIIEADNTESESKRYMELAKSYVQGLRAGLKESEDEK